MLAMFTQYLSPETPQARPPFLIACTDGPDLNLEDMQLPITISLVEMNKVLPKWREYASRRPTDHSRTTSHNNTKHVDDAIAEESRKGLTPAMRDQMFWPGAVFANPPAIQVPIRRGALYRLWDKIKRLFYQQ